MVEVARGVCKRQDLRRPRLDNPTVECAASKLLGSRFLLFKGVKRGDRFTLLVVWRLVCHFFLPHAAGGFLLSDSPRHIPVSQPGKCFMSCAQVTTTMFVHGRLRSLAHSSPPVV